MLALRNSARSWAEPTTNRRVTTEQKENHALYTPGAWRGRERALFIVVTCLPVLVALPGIASLSAHHGDEANFMEGAAHMIESGNYLVPVDHGKLVLDRAPLFYWLVAVSFRAFGLGVVQARIPTLVAAALIGALLYAFVLSVYGSARSGVYAVLAFVSCPLTWWISRLSISDTVMTLGVLMLVTGYYWATVSSHRRLFLVFASIGIGIAGMAKGHVGVVVAGVPAVALLVADRGNPQRLMLRDLIAPWTWGPALLLSGWWYVFLLTCKTPVGDFAPLHPNPAELLRTALVRFLWAEGAHQVAGWPQLKESIRFYIFGWFGCFAPWSWFVTIGFFFGGRLLRAEWREFPRPTKLLVYVIASVVLLFACFILELHRPRYLLPVAPAIAVLAARYCVRREMLSMQRPRIPAAVASATVMSGLGMLLFGVALPKTLTPPVETLAAAFAPRLQSHDAVFSAAIEQRWTTIASMVFARPVRMLNDREATKVAAFLLNQTKQRSGSVYLLTTPDFANLLQQEQPATFDEVARGEGGALATRYGLFQTVVALRVARMPTAGRDGTATPGRSRRTS